MNYSFGEDWVQLFDVVSVHAKKPIYFSGDNPYYSCQIVANPDREYPGPTHPIDYSYEHNILQVKNGLYLGGNYKTLIKSFKEAVPHFENKKLEVAYFGDHLRNDIQITKTLLEWKTIGIVEELEDAERECKVLFGDSDSSSSTNSDHPSTNKYWGSFFVHHHDEDNSNSNDDKKKIEWTFWGNEIGHHCDLYAPSLERIASFPPHHLFSNEEPVTLDLHMLLKHQE